MFKSFYNVTLSAFVQNYQGYAVGKRDHYYYKAQFVGFQRFMAEKSKQYMSFS